MMTRSSRPTGPSIQRTPVSLPEEACKGVYVVIAAYNEQHTIGSVVRDLRASFPNVVVVDDGSSDDTLKRASSAGATALRHLVNRGQGAALQTGIAYSLERGADVIVTFDADGQHCVEDVPYLVDPVWNGRAQVALGSRFAGQTSDLRPLRRALLKAALVFTWLTSGVRLTDTHNGLRAFSRDAARRIEIRLDRMAHASELIDQVRRSDLSWIEVPVRVRYTAYSRAKGQRSTQALKIALDYLLDRITR